MKRLLICTLLILSLGACALTVDEVDVNYNTAGGAAVLGGASNVQINVSASDARASNRDRISVKKNGYGMEMAAIVARQDIPTAVSKAIETELSARGFQLGKGPVFVLVDINKFYSDFKMGFFEGEAVAEVMLTTQVRNADGKLVYSKTYSAEGVEEHIQLASGSNAKAAVEKAFAAAIAQMVGDDFFIQSLVEAQRLMGGAPATRPVS